MTDGEKLLLDDAIEAAVRAERERLRLRAACFAELAVIFAMAAFIVGRLIWAGSF